jgi:hypothetical protein
VQYVVKKSVHLFVSNSPNFFVIIIFRVYIQFRNSRNECDSIVATTQYRDQCLINIRVKYPLSFEGARAPLLVSPFASSDECE